MKGIVVRWFPEKGFGFVRLEDNREVFFHSSEFSSYRRGQDLKDREVWVDQVAATPRGVSAKAVSLLRDHLESIETAANWSKCQEYGRQTVELLKAKRSVWTVWYEEAKRTILKSQKPHSDSARFLCPKCQKELRKLSGFDMYVCDDCSQTYARKYQTVTHVSAGGLSNDEMRDDGDSREYVDSYTEVFDETTPVVIPEFKNAAWKVSRGEPYLLFALPHVWYSGFMSTCFGSSGYCDEDHLGWTKEQLDYASAIPEPQAIPDGMDSEALFSWVKDQFVRAWPKPGKD